MTKKLFSAAVVSLTVLTFTWAWAQTPGASGSPPPVSGLGTSFGSEYYIPPSIAGDLGQRNVIVLKTDRGGAGGCNEEVYTARVFFENTDGVMVSNATGPDAVMPDNVWIFGFVCGDRDNPTTAVFIQEFIYAVPNSTTGNPSGGFDEAQGVEVNSDFGGDGSIDIADGFNYILTDNRSPLAESELVQSVEAYIDEDNEILKSNNFSTTLSLFERPVKIPAPLNETFDDVVAEVFEAYGSRSTRFRARGIGLIREEQGAGPAPGINSPQFPDSHVSNAIYYRIDGRTGGSLFNTPFQGDAQGLWFSE